MFFGLILGPLIIGIPVMIYGAYLSMRKDFTLRCAKCGRVYKQWQGLTVVDAVTLFIFSVPFMAVCFVVLWVVVTVLNEMAAI